MTSAQATTMRPGGLPGFSTTFVGREGEIDSIIQMLERPECRLVTIIGPGGAGKTRLAVEVAQRVPAGDVPRYFIDMATVTAGDAAALRVAQAFGVTLPRLHGDGETALAEALQDKAAIAVIDNFEHLVETCAESIGLVAAQCPEIRFIVTSRVALNVQQEWRFNLEGLGLDQRGSDAARRLFLDRASRVSGRAPADFDETAVGRICSAVDGMPLAIEMAAGWTRSLSEAEIAQELRRRLDLLTTSMRDLPERQRSMEAVFDQSCGLLNEQERQVFIRLGIFTGGFTRSAAIEVAGASLPLLATLVDHSLVSLEPGGRYRLHPLLRQYARNALETRGIHYEVRADHCRYYLQFMRRQLDPIRGGGQRQAIREMTPELGNMAQAWRALPNVVTPDEMEAVLQASAAAAMYMDATARYQDCQVFADGVVSLAPISGEWAARVEHIGRSIRGANGIRLGDLDGAEADLLRALELEDKHQISAPYCFGVDPGSVLPLVYLVRGEYERAAELARACQERVAHDDLWSKAIALYCLGGAHFGRGEYAKARTVTAQALELSASVGDQWFADYLHLQIAECALRQGAFDEAETHAEAARQSRVEFEDRQGQAHALLRLGDVSVGRGKLAEARERYLQALRLYRETSDKGGRALSQASLARIDAAEGDTASARARYLRALELAEAMDYAPALAEIFLGVAGLQKTAGDVSGAAAALAFVQRWKNAPLAVQQEAARTMASLKLSPAQQREAERQAEALSLGQFCRAMESVLHTPDAAAIPVPLDGELSRRELQVLALLDRGYTNGAVAKELGLTVSTVKWYCTQIFGKLGAANRTEALARARELGLLA